MEEPAPWADLLSIVFVKNWNLFHEQCNPNGTRTDKICSITCCPPCHQLAPRRIEDLAKWLAFNVMKLRGLILLFVLVLFGWPMLICHKQTTIWFGGNTICNVMSLQLGNCPILAVPHSSTSANHQQQTTDKPNTCSVRQGFEFKSNCSQFLSFE